MDSLFSSKKQSLVSYKNSSYKERSVYLNIFSKFHVLTKNVQC